MPKHQRKTNRPEGMSKKAIRKQNAKARVNARNNQKEG